TKSLAQLIFGAEEFRGENAFPGGQILDTQVLRQTNPLLGFAFISPTFTYDEKGVSWGARFEYRWGEDRLWHVGARLNLPFKVITTRLGDAEDEEETLEDVFKIHEIAYAEAGT